MIGINSACSSMLTPIMLDTIPVIVKPPIMWFGAVILNSDTKFMPIFPKYFLN